MKTIRTLSLAIIALLCFLPFAGWVDGQTPATRPVTPADELTVSVKVPALAESARLDRIEKAIGQAPAATPRQLLPVYNGVTVNREPANADPRLKPFTWLHGAMWHAGKQWKDADDVQLRVAGMIAAQSGAPVNFDHELGRGWTAEDVKIAAEHVKRLRVGALSTGAAWNVRLKVGVYGATWIGPPALTDAMIAEGKPHIKAAAIAAMKGMAPLWAEVDYVIVDVYLTEGFEDQIIRANVNGIRWLREASGGKPVLAYVNGRAYVANVGGAGGRVSLKTAKKHVAALLEAEVGGLILFGDYEDGEVYLQAVAKD